MIFSTNLRGDYDRETSIRITGGNVLETFNNIIMEPYLCSCDNTITEVNKKFIDLTGYALEELLGKSLIEIGDMLKINSQIFLDSINSNYSGYIFTKSCCAREVNISLFHGTKINEKVYSFIEKTSSRLDDKLIFEKQTFIDNILGVAIYSLPDLILLKANQKYLDFTDSHFNKEENSIGRHISKVITGFVGSQGEVICNTVIETQKSSCIKELEFDNCERGITYWDSTQTPIFENCKMKYIFHTANDVTKRVLEKQRLVGQNKIIQQQKEQLEQQNTQLVSIIENLSEGITFVDNKGKFIMINPEAKRLVYKYDIGINLSDVFKNTNLYDMKGNEIQYKNFPSVRALRGERVKNLKMFIKHPDKEYYVEISSIPIYNINGELTIAVTCFHDITETIEQSKQIEEHKKELEAIIENISDGISIFDKEGQYKLFNKSARAMYFPTYKHMDKIGGGYKQYEIDGEEIGLKSSPCHRVMNGEKFKNMSMLLKLPDKKIKIDVSGTPIYDGEGRFTLGVLCSRDMTDYYKREEAIISRFQILNRIIDTFDLPVVRLLCPALKIMDINKKAFDIIKLLNTNVKSIEYLKAKKIEDLFETFKTSDYYQCINEVLKEKKTKYLNKKNHWINGKDVYWNVIFEPMLEVNGELQEILILIIDVTPEIKSNIDMEKELKLQGEFLVNISHDLKTPLNVISATAQLVSVFCKSGSLEKKKNSVIEYIDSIKQNCYRLSKMINNIVDLSKIEAGFFKLNLSNDNIVEVVEEIVMSVTNFTKSKGLNIIFDTNIEEKIMACDSEKIERIILNLISNAIKFTEDGDEIFVDVKDKNEFVEISVKDNGIGIEKENLDMIFDRFKQVDKSLSKNAEGTGIGLSLVKSIVELHGGSIYVESEVGKGSKFTVILPTRKVLNENMIYSSKMRSGNESILVELSDIYS